MTEQTQQRGRAGGLWRWRRGRGWLTYDHIAMTLFTVCKAGGRQNFVVTSAPPTLPCHTHDYRKSTSLVNKLQEQDTNTRLCQRQRFPVIIVLEKSNLSEDSGGWGTGTSDNWMKPPFTVTLNLNNESGVCAGATSWPFHPSVEVTNHNLSFHLTDETRLTRTDQRTAASGRLYLRSSLKNSRLVNGHLMNWCATNSCFARLQTSSHLLVEFICF